MKQLLEKLRSRSAKLSMMMTLVIVSVIGSAFASETPSNATMATIQTATVNELTTVQQALLNLIQAILPVALVVMGSILVVTLGIRLFRRFAG